MKKEPSSPRDFTRGGQIYIHSLLMFWQVFRAGLIVAFMLFCLCFYTLIEKRTRDYDWYIYWQNIEASLRLVVHDKRITHAIRQPNGTFVTLKAIDFVRSPKTRFHVNTCHQALWVSLWQSGLAALLVLALYWLYLKRKGKQAQQSLSLDGTEQVDPETLRQLLKKSNRASPFCLAGVPLVKHSETQHILLAGTTGAGKSVAMQELMDQVRQQGQRAIVYDIDGAFIPT